MRTGRPRKVSPEQYAALQAEAARRAGGKSNRQLADETGLTLDYVGVLVAKIRRDIERSVKVNVEVSST